MFKPLTAKGSAVLTIALTTSTVFNGTQVLAEETSEAGQISLLEPFVVVGETTNTVVTPEALEKYQANDLADVFRHVPSVSVGGSVGIAQKIYIRGLEDTYLNVTVDGALQTGTLFHHIGRVSIEPELLKEVVVQAGAGEATSGAGAIGGAIRFKTKNADDLLDYGEQFGALARASYFSNDGEKLSVTGYGKLTDDWGFLGSFVHVDRDEMEDGDGNKINHTSAQQQLAFIKLDGQLTDSQTLTFSYENRKEEADVAQRPNWIAGPNDPVFPVDGERNTFVLNHTFQTSDLINLESTFYYTESEVVQDTSERVRGSWGDYLGATESYGLDIRNTSNVGQHTMTYGVDHRIDKSSSKYLDKTLGPAWAWDPSVLRFEEEGKVSGIYLQNHWQATDALLVSFGVRYDRYELEEKTKGDEANNIDVDSNGWSPNIGFNYSFTDNWKLSAGYAEAMRGKEVGDAFTLEHRPGRVAFQQGLDPEKVKNTEIGLKFDNGALMASATVYRTKINDVIFEQDGRGPFPEDSFYFENIGELETDGYELMLGYTWDNLSAITSFVHNKSHIDRGAGNEPLAGYEHRGLGNSRGDEWNLDISYQLSNEWDMGWHVTYVNDLNNLRVLQRNLELGENVAGATINKDSYVVHDVSVRWKPSKDLTLDFAVHNLFDKDYRDHSTVGDYTNIAGWENVVGNDEAGRDVRLTASYVF